MSAPAGGGTPAGRDGDVGALDRRDVAALDRRDVAALDRRDFVAVGAGALAALLAGGCATVAAVPAAVLDGTVQLRLSDHSGLRGPGGFLKLLPEGSALPLYLLADGAGGWSALSPVCTHLGCIVEVEGAALVCPCHGSTYDRSGRVLRGPAERALASYPVREAPAGTLTIDLEGRSSG